MTNKRFLIEHKVNSLSKVLPKVQVMASSEGLAKMIAISVTPALKTILVKDLKATELFMPLPSVVNLSAKKFGLVFYSTRREDGTFVDHICLVDSKMNSISCYNRYDKAIKAYKKLNNNTFAYSPDLLVEPMRFTPIADGGVVYIVDNHTGIRTVEGSYDPNSYLLVPYRIPLPNMIPHEVKEKCIGLNSRTLVEQR